MTYEKLATQNRVQRQTVFKWPSKSGQNSELECEIENG